MIRLIDERIMERLRDKPENIDFEEFVRLVGEWREQNASKSKCPYCVKLIEKQATKCNHCLSELEWFKFDGLYGPCKAGASHKMEAALSTAQATYLAQQAARSAAIIAKNRKADEELARILQKLAQRQCVKCSGLVFTSNRLENIDLVEANRLYQGRDYHNKCDICEVR
ncbi:hypothetical protein N9Y81_02335 [Akkermansiaceae bacterium]|jgi:acetylglutamate synthase|nr:hypothetical protein [Akkermansiaceae bacterium]